MMARILQKVAVRYLAFILPCSMLPQFIYAQVAYVANDTRSVQHTKETGVQVSGTMSLKNLLEQLHQRYQLRFVHDDQVIKDTTANISVKREIRPGGSVFNSIPAKGKS